MFRTTNRFFQITSAALFVLSLTTLIFLFFASQKGFDIGDEGFHLLAAQFPQEVQIWPNVAHIYTGLMFHLVGQNIIKLRILSEFMLFSSSMLFFFGLMRLTSVIYPTIIHTSFKIIACAMISLGALFYYIHFDTTPSYNTLNAILLNTAAGFLCFYLARQWLFSIFITGLLIGIDFLIKFPTAISLTVLFTIVLIIWPQANRHRKHLIQKISLLLLGIVTWILLHSLFLQPLATLWNTIFHGIQTLLTYGAHKPLYRLQYYTLEIIQLITYSLINFWEIYLALLAGLLITYWGGLYFIPLFFLAALHSFTLDFYKGGSIQSISLVNIYTAWLLLFLFSVIMTLIQQNKLIIFKNSITAKRLLIISMLLLLLPFAGAVGTANVITLNLTQYMAAWFGLMIILLSVLTYCYNNQWIFLSGTLTISLFAACQIISAGFIAPYDLNKPIQYQTIPTAIGNPPTYLKLDIATHEFFNQLNQIAKGNGFKPGNDIFTFGTMPGAVFALGGKSPVVPWYFATKEINERLLLQASPQRLKNAFILQNATSLMNMPNLAKFGIKFPENYILCGQLTWPLTGEWVRLWKPKNL